MGRGAFWINVKVRLLNCQSAADPFLTCGFGRVGEPSGRLRGYQLILYNDSNIIKDGEAIFCKVLIALGLGLLMMNPCSEDDSMTEMLGLFED